MYDDDNVMGVGGFGKVFKAIKLKGPNKG